MKKMLLGWIVGWVVIFILGWIIHGYLLMSLYEQAPEGLFRKPEEAKMWLDIIISIVMFFIFTYIYYKYITPKSMKSGIMFGLLIGISNGLGMGYGSYSWMPLPYGLALGWFLATTVEYAVAGVIWGWLIKEEKV